MRVPSIGLPLDERRIVREGYRIAEAMMRNYRDPPTLLETVTAAARNAGQSLAMLYRNLLRS
ncbi:MAG: hypothetical protein P0Y65_02345 [Candidatus Devosia phytovorans]|uniref:Uncharacterized protein n=1 Tax=Candidatus Devosia phytovorans TaxID=3121372 RepID=A0AAJ5VUM7_9HYPH|nr:hypothetical protein [Devosia sp.]WEK05114.1 MAG: hypothetical protein P0Y65_02345 [Devosia sp.]